MYKTINLNASKYQLVLFFAADKRWFMRLFNNEKKAVYIGLCLLASTCSAQILGEEQEDIIELEPVIVTGELLEKPLMESSTSVNILQDKDIRQRAGVNTLRDVLDSSVNVTTATGTGRAPTIRGIDGTGPAENANAFFAGSRPRLNWQIDGRNASYNEVVFADFGLFDVERVEMLRGPQSSLVGRNAIAGSVLVNTHNPSFEHEGELQLVTGNYGQRRASAMVNIPVNTDSVAIRLSADWFRRDSSVSYDAYEGLDDPGKIEGLTLRGKVLVLPDDKHDARLLLNIAHSDYSAPNGEIIVRPFSKRRSNFPLQPQHRPITTNVSGSYETNISDDWRVNLNLSVTDFEFKRTALPNTSSASINTTEYVFEPQIKYTAISGLKTISGLYVYKARQKEFIEFLGGQHFDDDTDTIAAYSEASIPITSVLNFTLGLRYEEEKRHRIGGDKGQKMVKIKADKTYQALLPKVVITWNLNENMSVGGQVSKGYNAGGGGVSFGSPIVNYEFEKETVWTYEVFARQRFYSGNVRTKQNLFYSDYKDMQLPFDLTPNNSRDEAFVVRNADSVHVTGLEAGIDITLTPSIDLWSNVALLKAHIDSFPNSGVEGNKLLMAPAVTANLGASWHYNNWQASVSNRFSGDYFSDVNNRAKGKTDAYVVSDVQVAYEFSSVRIFAAIKNVFDDQSPVARYPGLAPSGSNQPDSDFDSAVLLQPRTIQLGLKLHY